MNSFKAFCNDDAGQMMNSEILYSNVQRVYLKSKHKEERQKDLRVNVELLTGVSPVCQQTLLLQLMDDEDSYFLYTLSLTEDDFKHLKSEQGLLVDFDNFSNHFTKLLEMSRNGGDSPFAKFLLLLEEEDCVSILDSRHSTFKIVETNNFKHLCHLSLKITCAADVDLKKHMALKIKHLKDTVSRFEKQAAHLEYQLKETSEKLADKCQELERVHQHYNEEKSEIHVNNMRELTREREKLGQLQLDYQIRMEKERQELEEKHSSVQRGLEKELSQVKVQNQVFSEKLTQLESVNREQGKQLDDLGRELGRLHEEYTSLKKQNVKLDSEYHDKEKYVGTLQKKLAALEQELEKKAMFINGQNNQMCHVNEQKMSLEQRLKELENTINMKDVAMQKVSDDLVKANEIILKLQTEASSNIAKLKLRTGIAMEQERLLDKKQKDLNLLHTQTAVQAEQIQKLECIEKQLSNALAEANKKLEEKEKALRNNENVIMYLNRQLKETQQPPQHLTNGRVMLGPGTSTPVIGGASTLPTGIQAYLRNRVERPSSSLPVPVNATTHPPSQVSCTAAAAGTTSTPPLMMVKDTKQSNGKIGDTVLPKDKGDNVHMFQKNKNEGMFRSAGNNNVQKIVEPVIPSAYFPKATQ